MSRFDQKDILDREVKILEQQEKYAAELRDSIRVATKELTDSYMGLIDAKNVFDGVKKANLEEVRLYKFAISAEAKEICADVKRISESVPKDGMTQLLQFVDACERIQSLRLAGFFDTFRIV